MKLLDLNVTFFLLNSTIPVNNRLRGLIYKFFRFVYRWKVYYFARVHSPSLFTSFYPSMSKNVFYFLLIFLLIVFNFSTFTIFYIGEKKNLIRNTYFISVGLKVN